MALMSRENRRSSWPRVNLAYHRADFARASFVNDARICGTNFWRDLTRARHLLMSREKVGNMTRIWRASKFSKFCPIFQKICPIFKIWPDCQNFARFLKFCFIFKFLPNFHNFAQFSKFYPIFKILPRFQNFAPFSKFCPIFKISPLFQNFALFSKCWPIFKIWSIFKILTHFQNVA